MSVRLNQIIIYVHEGVTSEQLVEDASRRFNISLAGGLQVVPLRLTALVLPETYPRLTLLGQAWGAARLGQEALSKLVPEVWILPGIMLQMPRQLVPYWLQNQNPRHLS